jgi:hypothetical protein
VKVFQDLSFKGPPDALKSLLDRIEERASGEWRRDPDKEKELSGSPSPMLCYRCAAKDDREAASLWLTYRSDDELRVANVLPDETRRLDRDQYNRIVKEFHDELAYPASEGLGLEVTLTSDVATLDIWLSAEAIEKLRRFSGVANRSTGSSHPHDRTRWFDFIFTAHAEGSELPSDMLRRWLHEEERWFEEGAAELAGEYDTARELLTAYDRFKS